MSESESNGVPETFFVIMQKGIEDGCPPPEADALYLVTHAPMSLLFTISTKVRPEGAQFMQPHVYRQLKIADHAKSIVRLLEILSEIPTQYRGVEDMYGRRTSIVHVIEYERTPELHLSGADAPKGIPHPTEEQKVKFDEAVAIIENWGSRWGPK